MFKREKKKVIVGMSGGVDSAVAAALLVKRGYEVTGVFMQFWFPHGEVYGENRCCSLESFNQAKEVADLLGIKIHKLNVGQQFKTKIVDEFLKGYAEGQTPNPCIACNKFIKFELLPQKALTIFNADYIATGHYANIKKTKNKKTIYHLYRGKDKNKDQSYFLYNLNQATLSHTLFPLGNYRKDQVRKLAKKLNLPVHAKKDSQEICFVGASHYDFLNKYLKLKPGDITDENGRVLGRHRGLPLYTPGQRSGIGLSGGPWYVAGLDWDKNILMVTNDPSQARLLGHSLRCHKVNWVVAEPKFPLKCRAQIRYRGRSEKCVVTPDGNAWRVEFAKPQRAIAAGQSVVFYRGREALGGGIIL